LLVLAPANRRRVPPVQSIIPATWLAQSIRRQGVTFVVVQGGVGEVGLSIKAASPNAPACRTRLQHWVAVQRRCQQLVSDLCGQDSYHTTAIHRVHPHLAIPHDRLHHLTAQPPYQHQPPSKDASSASKTLAAKYHRRTVPRGPHTPAQITPHGCNMVVGHG